MLQGNLVRAVAIVGKQNNPLLLKVYNSPVPANEQGRVADERLSFHCLIHTAMDIVEEKLRPQQQSSPANISGNPSRQHWEDPYLGIIYALEDMAVYGYCTNTKLKFFLVLALAETTIKDVDMRQFFKRLHTGYCTLISNPFVHSHPEHDLFSAGTDVDPRESAFIIQRSDRFNQLINQLASATY